MNIVIKKCKKKIGKVIGLISIAIIVVLIVIISIRGKDIYSLLNGPQKLEEVAIAMSQTDTYTEKDMEILDHQYASIDIEMITGSYAEYGKTINKEMNADKTYYLMPVNQGTYFITIIADKNSMEKLNAMESDFINSIGIDKKNYAEPYTVEGGFQPLSTDARMYAMEYFEGFNENITKTEQLPNILSPYSFEIGYIGGESISTIYLIFYTSIILAVILVILLLLYFTNAFLYKVKEDIKRLPNTYATFIDSDFKDAEELNGFKYGEKMLYKETLKSYRIWAYENIIWIYNKEVKKHNKVMYEIRTYDKNGKLFIIANDLKKKSAEKCMNRIFDHCDEAIVGYQAEFDKIAKNEPMKLYEKIKELKETKKVKEKKHSRKKEKKEVIKEETKVDIKEVVEEPTKRKVLKKKHSKIEEEDKENSIN